MSTPSIPLFRPFPPSSLFDSIANLVRIYFPPPLHLSLITPRMNVGGGWWTFLSTRFFASNKDGNVEVEGFARDVARNRFAIKLFAVEFLFLNFWSQKILFLYERGALFCSIVELMTNDIWRKKRVSRLDWLTPTLRYSMRIVFIRTKILINIFFFSNYLSTRKKYWKYYEGWDLGLRGLLTRF